MATASTVYSGQAVKALANYEQWRKVQCQSQFPIEAKVAKVCVGLLASENFGTFSHTSFKFHSLALSCIECTECQSIIGSYNHGKKQLEHVMQFIVNIPLLTTEIGYGIWHWSIESTSYPPSMNQWWGVGMASDNMTLINIALGRRAHFFSPEVYQPFFPMIVGTEFQLGLLSCIKVSH